jgi:hypothetical protein
VTGRIDNGADLRRPTDFRARTKRADDYDVFNSSSCTVGRIFISNMSPPGRPWQWSITGEVVAPRVSSTGFAATLDEAKAERHVALKRNGPSQVFGRIEGDLHASDLLIGDGAHVEG